jgi:HSP20 family protein
MDEMLNRDFFQFRGVGAWTPAINLYEDDHAYHLCVELAGVHDRQIELRCANERRVVVAGVRSQPRPCHTDDPLRMLAMEIDEGRFRREVELPEPIDADGIEADNSEGFLWVTLPRKNAR